MKDTKKTLADRVRMGRIARGLTQQSLAQKTGLHVATIARIEQGESQGDLQSLSAIADLYAMTIEELRCLPAKEGRGRRA